MQKWNVIIIMILISFTDCRKNSLKVDISSIRVDIKIERLDRDLFRLRSPGYDSIQFFKEKYAGFFKVYNSNIIALGDPDDPDYPSYLQQFLTDSIRFQSFQMTDSLFYDLSDLEKKLETAFRYYKYHFPEKDVPKVYTMISGFNQSIATTSDALGISLDNYLGADCRFYRMLSLPEYKKMVMTPEKIPSDALYAWALSEFITGDGENLLAAMIDQGKIMYFLDAVFPDDPDYLKIGFKPEKIEWCKDHENAMWTYIVENKLLFDNDRMNIRRFIGPGPFTSSFTSESPGKTGVWIGWQIVRKYMKRNKDVSLSDLMMDKDYQKILNESGYDPQ